MTRTLDAHEAQLRAAESLVFEPRITQLSDGRYLAFDLRATDAPKPSRDTAPLWLSLPVQIVWIAGFIVLAAALLVALPVLGIVCLVDDYAARAHGGRPW